MAPSLRKRLSKRAPLDALSQRSDSASSPLLAALEHLPKSKEDLSSTPPPPKDLLSPQNSQKARRSPSKSLLDRYKVRAPNMKAAKSPTPGEEFRTPPGKTTSFKEDLRQDDERPLLNEGTPAKAAVGPPVKSTIRTVDGVDFQMVSSSQPPAAARRSRSADPPTTTPRNAAESQPLRRSTRSQTRREQRADSAVSESSEINSSTLPKNKDATAQESSKSQDNAPHLRSILKKKDPSPTTTPPLAAATAEAPSRPKIPRTIRPVSLSPKQTPPTEDHTPPTDNDSDSSSSSASSSPSIPALLSSAAERTTLKPKQRIRASIPPIKVLPPPPDAQLLPGLIWASPLSATSRPAKPWTWCKRWTCCRCEGDTIVEQGVCARLACGHHRCGTRCRVGEREREGRVFRF